MSIEISQDSPSVLTEYANISIAFDVREVLDVTTNHDGALQLTPRRVPRPYVKDYDGLGESPAHWAERFDLSTWTFFSALRDEHCVGRATVVTDTPSLTMLGGGIGSALFDAAVAWALSRGCTENRPADNQMEPTRPSSRANMSPWRAAHLARWADLERPDR